LLVFIRDVGVVAAVAEESQRRDRASSRKSKVKETKFTHQSAGNASNNLAGGDIACSDNCAHSGDVVQRRRLSERVSIDSVGGETTSGTEVKTRGSSRRRQKHSTPKVRQEADEVDFNVESVMSSGQSIKSSRNRVDEDSSVSRSRRKKNKNRGRDRNVNSSAQTASMDEDSGELEDVPTHSLDERSVGKKPEVDSEKLADMIGLLAAPILASEVKTALAESRHPGGKSSSPSGRSSQSQHKGHHHHHHHHHHRHQQQDDLHLISAQSTVGMKSIASKDCSLWNRLPDDVKSVNSNKRFRIRLKSYYLQAI